MPRPPLTAWIVCCALLASACVDAGETNAEPGNLDPPPPALPALPTIPDAFAPLDSYLGKTALEWAAQLKLKDDPVALKKALEALAELGPIDEGASDVARDLLKIVKETGDVNTARLALLTLGKIGPEAFVAEAYLTTVLNNITVAPSIRVAACRALIQFAPNSSAVRRAILAAANDAATDVRNEAIDALIVLAMPAGPMAVAAPPRPVLPDIAAPNTVPPNFGAKTKPPRAESAVFPWPPAIEALSKAALNARDARAADVALRTLGDSGIEPLLHALENASPAVRSAAAEALSVMKRAERRVLPALVRSARKDNDRHARDATILAAANLNAREPAVLDLLVELLGARFDRVITFQGASPEDLLLAAGNDALPGLRRALRSEAIEVRRAALKILIQSIVPVPEGAETNDRTEPTPASRTMPSSPLRLDDCLPDIAARLLDPDETIRLLALNALNRLGPLARAASAWLERAAGFASKLSEQIENQKGGTSAEKTSARTALANFQHLNTIALLNVTREPGSVACLSPLDKHSIEQLLLLLESASPTERADAALSLRLHGRDPRAAEALIAKLNDADPRVQRAAGRALGAFGPLAAAAVPTLIRWIEAEPKTRLAAIESMAELQNHAPGASAALGRSAAEDTWLDDATHEKTFVRALRAHAASVVPALIGYVRTGSPAVRSRAALALGKLGAMASDAMPALLELAQSTDDTEAHAAFEAIRSIGLETDPAVLPYLTSVIQSSLYASRRKWAVSALGQSRLGVAMDETRVGALLKGLTDSDATVCQAAYDALRGIGDPIVPTLVENVSRNRGAGSFWPLKLLASWKAEPGIVVPLLYEFTLPGNTINQRAEAVELLGAYGKVHSGVVPALVRALDSHEPLVIRAAIRALKPLEAQAHSTVEQLRLERDPKIRKIATDVYYFWEK